MSFVCGTYSRSSSTVWVTKRPQSPHSKVYRSSWWPYSSVHGSQLLKNIRFLQSGQDTAIGSKMDECGWVCMCVSFRSTESVVNKGKSAEQISREDSLSLTWIRQPVWRSCFVRRGLIDEIQTLSKRNYFDEGRKKLYADVNLVVGISYIFAKAHTLAALQQSQCTSIWCHRIFHQREVTCDASYPTAQIVLSRLIERNPVALP